MYVLAFDLRTRQASQALTRVPLCFSAGSLRVPPAGAGKSERSGGGVRAGPCSIPSRAVTSAALFQQTQLLDFDRLGYLHDHVTTTHINVWRQEGLIFRICLV
jgi:hypothetical protein